MPWTVSESDQCPTSKPWGVIQQDGTLAGCHPTKARALRQQAALYANEEGRNMPEPETKSFVIADVKAVDSKNPTGEFEAIISSTRVDRDNEHFAKRAFDPLPDHITIDIDHGVSVASTVGSGKPYYDGDVLKVKGTFSSRPIAQEVRTMVAEGHVNKMSVAFGKAVRESQKNGGGVLIKSAELLNAAFVAVPSNIDAAVLAIKSAEKPEDAKVPVSTPPEGAVRLTSNTTTQTSGQASTLMATFSDGKSVTVDVDPDDTKVGARLSKESMKALGRIHDECTSLGYDCAVAKDVRHMLEQHEAALRELRDDTEAEAKAAVEGAEHYSADDPEDEATLLRHLGDSLTGAITELRLGNTKRAESLLLSAAAHANALGADTKSPTDSLADPLVNSGAQAPDGANGEEGADVDEKATDLEQRNRAMQMRARVLAAESAPA